MTFHSGGSLFLVPTKDYVKRNRSNNRQAIAARTKHKITRPMWLSGAAAVIILTVGGIAVAHHHKQSTEAAAAITPTTPTTVNATPKVTNSKDGTTDATKPTTTPDGLPLPPENHWTYMDQLENKVIVVKENKQYDLPTVPFQMQCGAYRSEAQALQRQARIKQAGYDSMIKVSKQKSTWYRVVLGPYQGRRAAGVIRAKLHTKGVEGCAIWQWDA